MKLSQNVEKTIAILVAVFWSIYMSLNEDTVVYIICILIYF